MKVGLLLIATGKYDMFLPALLQSVGRYFLPDHDVHTCIFTDKRFTSSDKTQIFPIEHRPWPMTTLFRYKIFHQHVHELTDYDYLYYCDADSLIIDYIGNEILGERVATQHIGFTGVRGTPENRPQSLAYIDPREPMQYFAGGFNGGTSAQFLKMSETLSKNIDIDLANGVIARWHDESHMNRYFVDNPPTVILDPGYCFAQGWLRPYKQRILNLQKDNKELHV